MWEALLTALRSTGIPYAEQEWVQKGNPDTYGVLRRRGAGDALWADGHQQAQAWAASVHLFTREAGTVNVEKVRTVLNQTDGLSWQPIDCQYEDDTRYTHWTWYVEWV